MLSLGDDSNRQYLETNEKEVHDRWQSIFRIYYSFYNINVERTRYRISNISILSICVILLKKVNHLWINL